ncbi:hypothetical protein CQA70_25675, partial [Klebsiella pneumoniae]
GGRHGVCFAFAVLLDWALLGALMVRIRQQESAAPGILREEDAMASALPSPCCLTGRCSAR